MESEDLKNENMLVEYDGKGEDVLSNGMFQAEETTCVKGWGALGETQLVEEVKGGLYSAWSGRGGWKGTQRLGYEALCKPWR